jgi:hypothetical protein
MATNFIQNDGLKNEINEKLGVLLVDMPEPSAFLYTYIVEEKLFGNSVYNIEMSDDWEDVIKIAYKYTQEEAEKYPQFRWVSLEEL